MDSATDRLPSTRTLFTSWVTSGDWYTGSETRGRRGAGPLRGMSALLLLRAVPAASLLAVAHTLGVQRAADDLVADAGQVLHPAAPHEHHRVLLQVVADARDVRGHLDATGEADASDLAQRRVRLLRRRRVHAGAHATTLRGALQRRGLGLLDLVLAALADQLVDRGHGWPGSPTCAGSCFWTVLCSVVPGVLVLLGSYPHPAVVHHRSPRSGVSPFPGPAGDSNRIGRPPRVGATTCRQAHREREQAQGTLGTADHDTRVSETGQSRVLRGSAGGVEPCPPGYAGVNAVR